MGGGDGTIITRKSVKQTLLMPEVHGRLPATITGSLDPILAKDESTWTEHDVHLVSNAIHWSMCER